ncbi:MAG: hypothetical protein ABIP51_05485 [Bacteroidia bacterium]
MPKINNYPIYNLSNSHFQNVELVTTKSISLKGQFVQFKVVEDNIEYIYPSEKYCFLPNENKHQFWKLFNSKKGEFKELPNYIIQLDLTEIKKIIIEPILV